MEGNFVGTGVVTVGVLLGNNTLTGLPDVGASPGVGSGAADVGNDGEIVLPFQKQVPAWFVFR